MFSWIWMLNISVQPSLQYLISSMIIYFILVGLNMFRGEIFAYPMFLQKEFPTCKFVAMDVTCRYFPYLLKVTDVLHPLEPLKTMKPCLSVMHAKAHNTKCEVIYLSDASFQNCNYKTCRKVTLNVNQWFEMDLHYPSGGVQNSSECP